jgi:hypothetical protein
MAQGRSLSTKPLLVTNTTNATGLSASVLQVASVGGFPASGGNLTISSGGNTWTGSYSSFNANTNELNLVSLSGDGTIPQGASVILASGVGGLGVGLTTLYVESVEGFPTSGELLLSLADKRVSATYNGTDTVNNAFTGVQISGIVGFNTQYNVSLVNILGSTIEVQNPTGNFTSSGTLMIQNPPGVLPNRNVIVTYGNYTSTSNSTGIFSEVAMFPSGSFTSVPALPSGGLILQMPSATATGNYTYVDVVNGQNLPMFNLFPDAGTLPSSNDLVSAVVNLPDPTTSGILSGVAVIGVGSAPALVVGNSTVGTPTPVTNPNDIFGVFEWGLVKGAGSNGTLDFDVSQVDQVGFPFRSTTKTVAPPRPADPTLGVGMRQNREDLFGGFVAFLQALPAEANALLFAQGAAENTSSPFPVDIRITAPQDIIGGFIANPPVALGAYPTSGNATMAVVTAYYVITATQGNGSESEASNIISGTNTPNTQESSLQIEWSPYPYATGYNIYWSSNADMSGSQLIGAVTGGNTTVFVDDRPDSHTGNAVVPPANNYTYDPLSSYFTQAIIDFFDYYSQNEFVLDDQATKTKWTGNVTTMSGQTVLALTGSEG